MVTFIFFQIEKVYLQIFILSTIAYTLRLRCRKMIVLESKITKEKKPDSTLTDLS